MSNYPKLTITYGGHDMIAEAEAEQKPLIFTRVKIGAGQLTPGQNIETLTDTIDGKMTLPLNSGQKLSTGGAKLRFVVDNSALETGFFAREVAVYAKVGESGAERLYAYTNGGNYVDYVPDKTNPIDAQIIDVYLVTGNAANVQIEVSSSAYATIYDVADAIAGHNTAPDAHENRFAAVMAALGGYLPLAGGVMNGAITVGNCPGMKKATDREETYLYGGTTNKDGAAFWLRGVNCTEYGEEARGSFSLVAKSPSGESHTLSGLKDGRLIWDGKLLVYPVEVIVWDNHESNPKKREWYYCTKWNDGRAEIHGHAIQKANKLGITLNYPIPLVSGITGEATVVAAIGTAFNGLVSFTYGTTTVGYFTVRYHDYSVPNEPISICFTVRGYWK